MKLQRHMT